MMANRIADNFSRAATSYDANATLQKHWRARVLAHALKLLPHQAHLLDIGCGTGAFAHEAAPQRPHWRITNLDLAPGMCEQAGDAICADAAALPIADASLDGVVSSLCLQWVADKPRAMAEMARVLKPSKLAVVMTLASRTFEELSGSELRILELDTSAYYMELARRAGLQVLAMEDTTESHRYDSLSALLHSLRAIGAHAPGSKGKPLSTQRYRAIQQAYEANHAHPGGGVTATWQPLLLVLQKSGAV